MQGSDFISHFITTSAKNQNLSCLVTPPLLHFYHLLALGLATVSQLEITYFQFLKKPSIEQNKTKHQENQTK